MALPHCDPGDDSLLLKYLNPHMTIFITEKQKEQLTEDDEDVTLASSTTQTDGGLDNDDSIDEIYVTIVDTVSAQVFNHQFTTTISLSLSL